MKPYILGYVVNDYLPYVTEDDVKKLTHINLAFGLIKDGLLDMQKMTNMDYLPQLKKWNPELKIVLSVGGWGAGGFSTMALTQEGREAFAKSCLDIVEEFNLDGIDIDWEYPCDNSAGIDSDPRDKENYTYLFMELRKALGENRIVSNAVGAGKYFIEGSEMDKVAKILNYVQLMTYDMRSGFTSEAGHHASLYSSEGDNSDRCTDKIVKMYNEAGVPYDKMIVGAAFYCRSFTGVNDINNGLLQPSESIGEYGPEYYELTEEFIKENGFKEYWDEDAKASYLYNGKKFISFESPEAIALKAKYVKDNNLLGIMYWEHSCDRQRELLNAMYNEIIK